MKALICNLLCFVLLNDELLAQQPVFNFAQGSVQDFQGRLKAPGGAPAAALVGGAFRARRMDLLRACFENPYAAGHFLRLFDSEKDVGFQEQLLLMMLRASAGAWFDAKPSGMDWLKSDREAISLICREVLRRRIDVSTLKLEDFSSPDARGVIAKAFEAALSGSREAKADASKAIEPAGQQLLTSAASAPSTIQPAPSISSNDSSTSGSVELMSPLYKLVSGAAALSLLAWLRLRKHK